MLNIEEPAEYRIALHHLAFRPFFLLAGVFAVVVILVWTVIYHHYAMGLILAKLPSISWHAHEMIFGYGMAVVAGFLLTAMKNWTGVQTLHGFPLMLLALCWLLARLVVFIPVPNALLWMAVFDLLFSATLCLVALLPVIRVKQWKQLGVWSKLLLLTIANVLFYLGSFGVLAEGVRWGLYTGLYMLISLVLLMGRRVIPFFIERGLDYAFQPVNRNWVDIASLVLMLAFWLLAVFSSWYKITALVSLLLFLLHVYRMTGWYTRGIWRKPLLWVLYLAYGWIVAGFGLYALSLITGVSPMLAIHAFAYGGVGLMTLGMMARVILGHTGREVSTPPASVAWMFILVFVGAIFRVIPALFLPDLYALWIGISQGLWIAGFALFAWVYVPMLIRPRVDGRYG